MPIVGNQTNVSVVNTPNVTATIAGTPNVSVTNTPNVSVTNIPSVNINNIPNVKRQVNAFKNLSNASYTVAGGTFFEGTIFVGGGASVTINGTVSLTSGVHDVTLGAGTSISVGLAPCVISGVEYVG